ncbi:unnamed protein product [Prorocentrum cordatum]|uniref:Uncharacterized protein n=1 Tax=Prorocentrum cordatum TaxID=2364126 RepID=A0ABN9SIH5_9DINO|nr:unnamed protein product [Polarella glacialis]
MLFFSMAGMACGLLLGVYHGDKLKVKDCLDSVFFHSHRVYHEKALFTEAAAGALASRQHPMSLSQWERASSSSQGSVMAKHFQVMSAAVSATAHFVGRAACSATDLDATILASKACRLKAASRRSSCRPPTSPAATALVAAVLPLPAEPEAPSAPARSASPSVAGAREPAHCFTPPRRPCSLQPRSEPAQPRTDLVGRRKSLAERIEARGLSPPACWDIGRECGPPDPPALDKAEGSGRVRHQMQAFAAAVLHRWIPMSSWCSKPRKVKVGDQWLVKPPSPRRPLRPWVKAKAKARPVKKQLTAKAKAKKKELAMGWRRRKRVKASTHKHLEGSKNAEPVPSGQRVPPWECTPCSDSLKRKVVNFGFRSSCPVCKRSAPPETLLKQEAQRAAAQVEKRKAAGIGSCQFFNLSSDDGDEKQPVDELLDWLKKANEDKNKDTHKQKEANPAREGPLESTAQLGASLQALIDKATKKDQLTELIQYLGPLMKAPRSAESMGRLQALHSQASEDIDKTEKELEQLRSLQRRTIHLPQPSRIGGEAAGEVLPQPSRIGGKAAGELKEDDDFEFAEIPPFPLLGSAVSPSADDEGAAEMASPAVDASGCPATHEDFDAMASICIEAIGKDRSEAMRRIKGFSERFGVEEEWQSTFGRMFEKPPDAARGALLAAHAASGLAACHSRAGVRMLRAAEGLLRAAIVELGSKAVPPPSPAAAAPSPRRQRPRGRGGRGAGPPPYGSGPDGGKQEQRHNGGGGAAAAGTLGGGPGAQAAAAARQAPPRARSAVAAREGPVADGMATHVDSRGDLQPVDSAGERQQPAAAAAVGRAAVKGQAKEVVPPTEVVQQQVQRTLERLASMKSRGKSDEFIALSRENEVDISLQLIVRKAPRDPWLNAWPPVARHDAFDALLDANVGKIPGRHGAEQIEAAEYSLRAEQWPDRLVLPSALRVSNGPSVAAAFVSGPPLPPAGWEELATKTRGKSIREIEEAQAQIQASMREVSQAAAWSDAPAPAQRGQLSARSAFGRASSNPPAAIASAGLNRRRRDEKIRQENLAFDRRLQSVRAVITPRKTAAADIPKLSGRSRLMALPPEA